MHTEQAKVKYVSEVVPLPKVLPDFLLLMVLAPEWEDEYCVFYIFL